jgi:hypothetical protein
MMVEAPIVVDVAPSPVHGETAESPNPVPSRINTIESTAAPAAPAKIAPQETPEVCVKVRGD